MDEENKKSSEDLNPELISDDFEISGGLDDLPV